MRLRRLGIVHTTDGSQPWGLTHASTPFAFERPDGVVEVYYSTRDASGRSSIASVATRWEGERLVASSAPVMQLTRRAIAGGLNLPFDEAVRHAEDVYLNQLLGTEDVEEGLRAVSEKRRPAWKDR